MEQLIIPNPEALETTQPDASAELARDFFDDVWARGNTDHIDNYLDDHFYWNAGPGYSKDRAGYVQCVKDLHNAFPDAFWDIEEVVSQDGTIAMHWCMAGHFGGTWMGLEPTGKKIRMEGVALQTVVRGRVVSEFSFQDTAALLMDMGVTDLSKFGPDTSRS